MAVVQARLVHRVPGRIRLRIAARKNQAEFFQNLAAVIQACEGVELCSYKAQTGSVLIHYQPNIISWEGVCAFAEANALFVCSENDPAVVPAAKKAAQPIPSIAQLAADGLGLVDDKMSSLTKGLLDLQSFYFLAHVGLGVRQLARGHILSPAYTLLWRSLELANRKRVI